MNTNELIKNCLNDLHPKKVLDLGVGKGRCSKRFLEKGSEIIGVDIINHNLSWIKFIQTDIKNFRFNKKYNLIIASLVLHFLNFNISKRIIEKMKKSTEIEGHNFILTMNKKDNFYKSREKNFYVNEEDLRNLYCNWKIVRSGNFETELEEHDNLKPHKHNLSFILAKKINEDSQLKFFWEKEIKR